MRFTPYPLDVISDIKENRSRFASGENSINYYVEYQQPGRTEATMLPWPVEVNLTEYQELDDGEGRGLFLHRFRFFFVIGEVLYRRASRDGVNVIDSLGTIPGTGPVYFSDFGDEIVITTDNSSVAVINGTIITNAQRVYIASTSTSAFNAYDTQSQSNEDISVSLTFLPEFNIDYTIRAAAKSDNLKQIIKFENYLVVGSSESIEYFEFDETVIPPITPIVQQATVNVGFTSNNAAAASVNFLYFLGSDGAVYRMSGLRSEMVSSPQINKILNEKNTDDAYCYCVPIHGNYFYVITMPAEGMTLAFSESSGTWTRLVSGTNENGNSRASFALYNANFKNLSVQNKEDGKIYRWSTEFDRYNRTSTIRRIDSAVFNAGGERLIMQRVRFQCQLDKNTIAEQPKYRVSYSTDGGATFSDEDWLNIDRLGQGAAIIDWYKEIVFYDIIIRIETIDAAFSAMSGAVIYAKPAGW